MRSSGTFSQCARRIRKGCGRFPFHRLSASTAFMRTSPHGHRVLAGWWVPASPPAGTQGVVNTRRRQNALVFLLHLHGLAALHHVPVHHHHLAVLHVHRFPVLHLHRAVHHDLGAVAHRHLVLHRAGRLPVLHHHHLAVLHHNARHLGGHETRGKDRHGQECDCDQRDYAVRAHRFLLRFLRSVGRDPPSGRLGAQVGGARGPRGCLGTASFIARGGSVPVGGFVLPPRQLASCGASRVASPSPRASRQGSTLRPSRPVISHWWPWRSAYPVCWCPLACPPSRQTGRTGSHRSERTRRGSGCSPCSGPS